MKTLKNIGAFVFALLAAFALLGMAEMVLLKQMGFSTTAPSAGRVLLNLLIALLFAAISAVLYISASRTDNTTNTTKTDNSNNDKLQ